MIRTHRSIFIGILIALFAAGFIGVQAQSYSIQADEYPNIGVANTLSADSSGHVSVVVGSPGEGKVWDFTQPLKSREIPWEVVAPSATPFSTASIPGAEWAIRTKQWLSVDPITGLLPNGVEGFFDVCYYQKSDAAAPAVTGLGIGTTTPFFSGGYPYASSSTDAPFPLGTGKTWQRAPEFSANTTITYYGFPIATTLLTRDDDLCEVDAAGRLTLPLGTFDCLRIKAIRRVTLKARLGTSWLTLTSDTMITYEWWTKKAGMLLQVSSHSGEKNAEFTDAAYVARVSSTTVDTGVDCTPRCSPDPAGPSSCGLGQNYPNPFNPETRIRYTLAEPSRVEVAVYSLLGQTVAVLESGGRPAGEYSLSWNGTDRAGTRAPSGVYVCRMTAVSERTGEIMVSSRKMVLGQ
jgi:hypothetical protein